MRVQLMIVLFAICLTVKSESQSNEQAKGISNFALDFYQQCAQLHPDDNIIVSPLSVANALMLLSQGCNGNTFEELRNGLHLNNNEKKILANQFNEYYELLRKNAGNTTLSIVNKIYVQNKFPINKDFREVAVHQFSSDIESLDFVRSNESARIINQFIGENTEQKVKDVVDAHMFNASTRVILVNAIHFTGTWKHELIYYTWKYKTFNISETESVDVNYMFGLHRFNCGDLEDLNAQALEMEYANSNYSFLIIQPHHLADLPELEIELKNYSLAKIYDQMSVRIAKITIPRMKLEMKIELNDILKKMGMAEMFSEKADFSGVSENSSNELYLSNVIHKAIVEINEKGTIKYGAGIIRGSTHTEFNGYTLSAHHAFIFYIVDTESNTILFSGRAKHLKQW